MNAKSYHHPAQKHRIIKTLYHRVRKICDQKSLAEEKTGLTLALNQNGYDNRTIYRALKWVKTTQQKLTTRDFMQYVEALTEHIGGILHKNCILPTFKSNNKIKEHIYSGKQKQDKFLMKGIYKIPYQCGMVYIGD